MRNRFFALSKDIRVVIQMFFQDSGGLGIIGGDDSFLLDLAHVFLHFFELLENFVFRSYIQK